VNHGKNINLFVLDSAHDAIRLFEELAKSRIAELGDESSRVRNHRRKRPNVKHLRARAM
jgi:hypothetical protein